VLFQELKNEFPRRIEVISKDLFGLAKLDFQDNQDGGSRVQSLFCGVHSKEWHSGNYYVYCNAIHEFLLMLLCLYAVLSI
jgi:hypothetical protein